MPLPLRAIKTSLTFASLLCSLPVANVHAQNLLQAALGADAAAVQARLAAGADVNQRDVDGSTAALYAAHRVDSQMLDILLEAGADPNLANRYGLAPLHEAATTASVQMIAALLDAGALVDAALPEGETPLMLAARTSGVEAVQLLIDRGADVNVVESWQGQTPLMYAAAHDRGAVVAALLDAGADVEAKTPLIDLPERLPAARFNVEFPPGGMSALLFAARQGATAALSALIAGGADVDARTVEGFSALVLALHNRHNDAARLLIEAGADASGGALYTAIDARNRVALIGPRTRPTGTTSELELLAAMLERGADVMDRPPIPLPDRDPGFGAIPAGLIDTALTRAARSADVAAMQLLIGAGADPAIVEPSGMTLLLAVTAGPEIPPLTVVEREMPEESDAIDAIDLLLEFGLDLYAGDRIGATALHMAAKRGFVAVAEHLIAAGADIDATDSAGNTPLDYALGRSPVLFGTPPASPEAADYLRSIGAREGEATARTTARQ